MELIRPIWKLSSFKDKNKPAMTGPLIDAPKNDHITAAVIAKVIPRLTTRFDNMILNPKINPLAE
jgi:hypothetical protein